MPTATPILTREDLYVTIDIGQRGRRALLKRFEAFITAAHKTREEYVTPQFVKKQAAALIERVLDEIYEEIEDQTELGEFPELPDDEQDFTNFLVRIENAAEQDYRARLAEKEIKLPKRRYPASADNMNLAA